MEYRELYSLELQTRKIKPKAIKKFIWKISGAKSLIELKEKTIEKLWLDNANMYKNIENLKEQLRYERIKNAKNEHQGRLI